MNYQKIFILMAIFAVSVPQAAFASSVVRTGETISIEKDQKIEGDFYVAASVLSISGEVDEDLISLAARNTLNGKVGKDALMLGASVDVHGAVGEDLRVVAGDVIIAEPVSGDVFIVADSVKILSTASVGGDLVVYGGTVEVSGSVGGNIIGTMDTLRVDAPVAKGIDVSTKQLTLGDRAVVTENVRYVSAAELVRSPDTQINGEVTRNDIVGTEDGKASVRHIMIGALILLFSALAWFLIARTLMVHMVDRALVRGVRPVLLGFITLIAAPVVFIVLTVSIIGTLVGIAGLFVYLVLLIASVVGVTATVGALIAKQLGKNKVIEVTPYTLIYGALAVAVLVVVPILGAVLLFAAFLVSLGALVDLILRPKLS